MTRRLGTIWVLARREVVTRARGKAFRISTALLVVAMVAGIVIPVMVARGPARYTVAVTGTAAGLPAAVHAAADAAGITVTIRGVPSRAVGTALVESGAASATVAGTGTVIWKNTVDQRLGPVLTTALAGVTIGRRAAAMGLTAAQAAALLAPARPAVTLLHPQPDRTPQLVIAMVGMILLFTALNLYGSYVLTGVVEEKSSRVVEVLLARVRPADLLAGKVAGIGLLGIGQFALLGAVAAVTLQAVHPPRLPAGTALLIVGVVAWFILGYAFYSVLYGALGALASRTEDAQAAVAPVTVIMVLIYLGAFAAVARPHAWWVTACSLFPPTAPIFMPLRTALTSVPAWQVTAAVLLMIGGTFALMWAGGRVYRGAVLRMGQRIRLRQAWHGE
jgi:ABC-2 type transport system permease protein